MVRIAKALLASFLLLAVPARAQSEFLLLGEDPTGDPTLQGLPYLDTAADINSLAVAFDGSQLIFHLGLESTTSEAAQICYMVAFTFEGSSYVGLECFEHVAYLSSRDVSDQEPPTTSRGTNVASSVVLDGDLSAAVITIPIEAFGAKKGDTIEGIYGLTYVSRALIVTDTLPDAKRDAAAEESLGSYTLGGAAPAEPEPVAPMVTTEDVLDPFLTRALAWGGMTHTYLYNWTPEALGVMEVRLLAAVENGTITVTIGDPEAPLATWTADAAMEVNETVDLASAGPMVPVRVHGEAATGSIELSIRPASDAGDGTGDPTDVEEQIDEESQDSPGVGLLPVLLLGLAAVAWRRR